MANYTDYGPSFTDKRQVEERLEQISEDLAELGSAIEELKDRLYNFNTKVDTKDAKEIRELADSIDVFLSGADYLLE